MSAELQTDAKSLSLDSDFEHMIGIFMVIQSKTM